MEHDHLQTDGTPDGILPVIRRPNSLQSGNGWQNPCQRSQRKKAADQLYMNKWVEIKDNL